MRSRSRSRDRRDRRDRSRSRGRRKHSSRGEHRSHRSRSRSRERSRRSRSRRERSRSRRRRSRSPPRLTGFAADLAAVEAAAARGDAEAALRLAAALAEATRGYLPRGAGLRDTLALACRRGRVREATRLLERVKAALGPKQASRRARPVDAGTFAAALRALPQVARVPPGDGAALARALAAVARLEPPATAEGPVADDEDATDVARRAARHAAGDATD